MKKLIKELEEWGEQTFPNGTPEGVLNHLLEEIGELRASPKDPHEIADVFILIVQYCKLLGLSLGDITRSKFEILKTREWQEPDENNVIRHRK